MNIEIKGVPHFYEGPDFLHHRRGQFDPQKEYEIREDYIQGTTVVSSRRMEGRFSGTEIQRLVDLKIDLLNMRESEPCGVWNITDMINWVNRQ